MKYVAHFRCPECHHVIEKERLFEVGCPLCGWVSPLKGGAFSSVRRKFEPLADVFDEPNCFRIVAELPGISEDEIKTSFDPENNSIVILAPSWRYYKKIDLSSPAVGKVTTSYKNGVLEVRVKKRGA